MELIAFKRISSEPLRGKFENYKLLRAFLICLFIRKLLWHFLLRGSGHFAHWLFRPNEVFAWQHALARSFVPNVMRFARRRNRFAP